MRTTLLTWISCAIAFLHVGLTMAEEQYPFCFSQKSIEALLQGKANEDSVKRTRRNMKNYGASQEQILQLQAIEELARQAGASAEARQALLKAGQFTPLLEGPVAEQAILDVVRKRTGLKSPKDLANFLNEFPYYAAKDQNREEVLGIVKEIVAALDQRIPKLELNNLHQVPKFAKTFQMKPEEFRVVTDAWELLRQTGNHDAIAEAIAFKLLQPPTPRVVKNLLKIENSTSVKEALSRWALQARHRLNSMRDLKIMDPARHRQLRNGVILSMIVAGGLGYQGYQLNHAAQTATQSVLTEAFRDYSSTVKLLVTGKTQIRPSATEGETLNYWLPESFTELEGRMIDVSRDHEYTVPNNFRYVRANPTDPKQAAFLKSGYILAEMTDSQGKTTPIVIYANSLDYLSNHGLIEIELICEAKE